MGDSKEASSKRRLEEDEDNQFSKKRRKEDLEEIDRWNYVVLGKASGRWKPQILIAGKYTPSGGWWSKYY